MFTFFDHDNRGSRRSFLRFGASAAAGLGLTPAGKLAGASGESLLKGRSVIFLFLHGGPSQ
ncbi:MAG: DUF1501 domain-containing protein, partial [Isosphaeraceae bacterium]